MSGVEAAMTTTGAREDQALGEAVQPSVKMSVEEALDSVASKVGEVVTDKMTEKFPALKKVGSLDTLVSKAKEVAKSAVDSRREEILDFMEDVPGDLEGSFPKILTLVMQAVKAASTSAVDELLKMVPGFPDWMSMCCKKPSADSIKEEAFNAVSGEVKAKLEEQLKEPVTSSGDGLPEALATRLREMMGPMFRHIDVDASVGDPRTRRQPRQQAMMGGVSRRLTDSEARAVSEALQPTVKSAVEDALNAAGPEVGEDVAKMMTEKFPALKSWDAAWLIDKSKDVAMKAIDEKRDMILDYVEDSGDDVEGNLPQILSLIMQAVRLADRDTVKQLLAYLPGFSCCGCCKQREVEEEVYEKVSGEVKAKLEEQLKVSVDSAGLPEALASKTKEVVRSIFSRIDVNAKVGKKRATRRLTDSEARAVGEAVQPSVKTAVDEALNSIGPKVGEVVTNKMTEKFPALKKLGPVDSLADKAKEVAEQAVNSKRGKIMDFVQDASSDLEGSFPKILSLVMQAVKAASTSAVEELLKMVPGFPDWMSMCCKKPSADSIKEEAFNAVSGEVKAKLEEQLKEPAANSSAELPEALASKAKVTVGRMLRRINVDAAVGEPRTRSCPEQQTMGGSP